MAEGAIRPDGGYVMVSGTTVTETGGSGITLVSDDPDFPDDSGYFAVASWPTTGDRLNFTSVAMPGDFDIMDGTGTYSFKLRHSVAGWANDTYSYQMYLYVISSGAILVQTNDANVGANVSATLLSFTTTVVDHVALDAMSKATWESDMGLALFVTKASIMGADAIAANFYAVEVAITYRSTPSLPPLPFMKTQAIHRASRW